MTISNAAFDKLMEIYEVERILFAAAHPYLYEKDDGHAALCRLARMHGIDPDQE